MTTKLRDILIDPNGKDGTLSEHGEAVVCVAGHGPVSVGECLRRISRAQDKVRNLQLAINNTLMLIDQAIETATIGE